MTFLSIMSLFILPIFSILALGTEIADVEHIKAIEGGIDPYSHQGTLPPRPPPRRKPQPSDEPEWDSFLLRLFEIECLADAVRLNIHHESSYSLKRPEERALRQLTSPLTSIHAGANATDPACQARNNESATTLVLHAASGQCGMRWRNEETTEHRRFAELDVTFNIATGKQSQTRQTFTFPVQCIYPAPSLVSPIDRIRSSLRLFDSRYSTDAWRMPHHIPEGSQMFIESRAQSLTSWLELDELENVPVNCWIAPDNVYATETGRQILKNGCPLSERFADGTSKGLSSVHAIPRQPTRVGVTLSDGSLIDLTTSQGYSIRCDVLSCVRSQTKGVYGLPKCPPSHYCAIKPSTYYWGYRNISRLFHVEEGPIIISEEIEETESEPCSQCRDQSAAPISQVTYVGLSIETVAIIAFACFVFGGLTTTLIWLLHNRTRPAKFYSRQAAMNGGLLLAEDHMLDSKAMQRHLNGTAA